MKTYLSDFSTTYLIYIEYYNYIIFIYDHRWVIEKMWGEPPLTNYTKTPNKRELICCLKLEGYKI